MRVIGIKMFKIPLKFSDKGGWGGGARCAGAGSAFVYAITFKILWYILSFNKQENKK